MHDRAKPEPIPHFGKTVKGKNFFNLPFLRHQYIKTSLYAISKNVSVLPFFLIFMCVREKLQFTVSFDHPVTINLLKIYGHFYIILYFFNFWFDFELIKLKTAAAHLLSLAHSTCSAVSTSSYCRRTIPYYIIPLVPYHIKRRHPKSFHSSSGDHMSPNLHRINPGRVLSFSPRLTRVSYIAPGWADVSKLQ